jgi:hypothetical protein
MDVHDAVNGYRVNNVFELVISMNGGMNGWRVLQFSRR